MKAATWSALAGVAIRSTILSLSLVCASGGVQAAGSNSEAIASAIRAGHFAEPLIPTAATSAEEDQALLDALAIYNQRPIPGDVTSLTKFLEEYPHSGWAPALNTNLGLSYLHDGYFSRAIDVWQKAWVDGKDATAPQARALVDRAVGELAQLDANLGRTEQLTALLKDIGKRPITGSVTEAIQTASEQIAPAKLATRHLFICGPLALKQLMLARNASFEKVDFLQWYKAGDKGTSLAEVGQLAEKAGLSYRLVMRQPGQPVPMPSVVHWKVGHFAAIVGEANGRFHIKDTVFPTPDLWVTEAALDAEASGYFLVPSDVPLDQRWRAVEMAEAATVWGKGETFNSRPGDAGDKNANGGGGGPGDGGAGGGMGGGLGGGMGGGPGGGPRGGPGGHNGPNGPDGPDGPPTISKMISRWLCPLCSYNIKESSVSVSLSDTPVGYSPPIGPSAKVGISYNQREDSQPAVFSFFNVSPKWTISWLSYVTDDPTNPGANVSRYMSGGGAFYYLNYNASTGTFAAEDTDGSILVRASGSPIAYRHLLRDGSVEIYAQADGAVSFPRRIFLSQVVDPQGNAVTLNYDSQQRLVSLTDATGRTTTFTYGVSGSPLLVTKITDPFGRSATLTYDGSGRLNSITDIIGLTSSFTYDANSLVNSMMTPYGTTSFAYTAPGTTTPPRFVEVTDPLGYHEREEWLEPAPVPTSDPGATVPQGMPTNPTNFYLEYRDSFHWDKDAYVAAGCTPTGGCDYSKARIRHFVHMPNSDIKGTAIESVKYPLENRVWYEYPGQSSSIFGGTYDEPIAVGRVLDDGTTQLTKFSYDASGFFNLTQAVDPTGRTTSYTYANQIDLAGVSQTTQNGFQTTIAQYGYNGHHRPLFYIDAAGETTSFTYNGAGQLTSSTDPKGEKTSYHYDSLANLTSVTNANNATALTYTYDSFDRVRTLTDSEGWTVTYDYDAADRVTKITYPDGTADFYTYNKLDLASFKDRENRVWGYTYDANRRRTKTIDPLGNQTLFGYDGRDQLTSLTDPKTNVTIWAYDVRGRLASKQYADSSTVAYTYENTTSRLKSVLDALGQTKQFSYAQDNRPTAISYLNAIRPTPNVSFTYDTFFPRIASMTDGNGPTQYSYVAPFSQGALQLQQEGSPTPSSSIVYSYDESGRPTSRTVAGSGPETFGYDAVGRMNAHTSDLGSFTLSYLGETEQVTSRQLASSTLSTSWTYLPNSGDRRLAQINNVGLSASQFSTYQYITTPENLITAIAENSDSSAVYPSVSTQTASYNNLNQLTNLSGQALSYDANGNLLSDGQRNYSWDAENRLVGISYPGRPDNFTAFAYDGLNRRTRITTGGGATVATSYIWCGAFPCQAKNGDNSTAREYFAEGEFVPGTPGQSYYYGTDQIGSVRRVFSSPVSAPAYNYDPYGVPLQATAPLTDFGYAGTFNNVESGLYLTWFRAYNPIIGRWLSRDPLRETGIGTNLYVYAGNGPPNGTDSTGLCTLQIGIAGNWIPTVAGSPSGVGVAIDSQGHIGFYTYGGGGVQIGANVEGGLSIQFSNAQTIGDLRGWFGNIAGHGGVGLGGSMDYFTGDSPHGPVTGGGATVGAAAGASFTGAMTYTSVYDPFE
ncbi:peptidase C39 [Mesorhizobium sp. SARCC-RB16n]|uniref:RHS repeat-associated core domain-containing protein n=1 Tax=Mesorhizobium sp. SARCC-RB16n TaxID=2116687 RepID=UPI00122EFCED|nr:RHS repeat-associated core domain-containing protein [Mesorhizobium sp. SARCC-RB16n]KAA3445852.1 peptidase C39 [Mesorhizobium sp. SARCC-RB16n]